MTRITLILFYITLISCHSLIESKGEQFIIELEFTDPHVGLESVNNTVEILSKRINHFGLNSPIQLDAEDKTMTVSFPASSDTSFAIRLLTRKGKFRMYETFNNFEYNQYLVNIHNLLEENDYFGIEVLDPVAGIDSPSLFRVFNPSLETNDRPMPGPNLGYCNLLDTSVINSILELPEVQELLPANSKINWHPNLEMDTYSLVAIKKTFDYVPISNEMIAKAENYKSEEFNSLNLSLALKDEFKDELARLSRKNIGKNIAIVIDDYVHSYPSVIEEIKGGRVQVSGLSDSTESQLLAAILSNGELKTNVKVKSTRRVNMQ